MPNDEIRALWVVRYALTSPEKIDRLISFAVNARFQLLFVQVRGRGDAYYRSSIEPDGIDLELPIEQFDPLSYLIARAHEENISVHAWLNVFYVWSNEHSEPPPGHVVRRHPEWLLTDDREYRMDSFPVDVWKARGPEGYFLSPSNPDVRSYILDVLRELIILYHVDGVHLDYIRYPGPAYGFGEAERTRFALYYGIDPLALRRDRSDVGRIVGEQGLASLDSLNIEWRVQQVDSMVQAIRGVTGALPLSAAVVADPDLARSVKAQDWPAWAMRGDVDFVVLMAYTQSPVEIDELVRRVRNMIGLDRFLVGLPLFDGRASYLEFSLSFLRANGVHGFSLFSYQEFEDQPYAARYLQDLLWGNGE